MTLKTLFGNTGSPVKSRVVEPLPPQRFDGWKTSDGKYFPTWGEATNWELYLALIRLTDSHVHERELDSDGLVQELMGTYDITPKATVSAGEYPCTTPK